MSPNRPMVFAFGTLLVLALTGVSYAQQLIVEAAARNSLNPTPAIVPEGLQEGSRVFTDRTFVFRQVPDFLVGAEYVMLSNGDKTSATYELDITLSGEATLCLFIDNRVGDNLGDTPPTLAGVMQWVMDMGFESTYAQIGIDEQGQGTPSRWSTIYRLEVHAGMITLYAQNDGGSRNMYAVAAVRKKLAADKPNPPDQQSDVYVDASLSWAPGAGAVAHDVYLGTVRADVEAASRANPMAVLLVQAHDVNACSPSGILALGQTYYWRVDEVSADGTITKGPIWQFQTEPIGYPIPPDKITATASSWHPGSSPDNTINTSGLGPDDSHSTLVFDMWQTGPSPKQPVWIQYAFARPYKLHQLLVWNYNADLEFLVGFGVKDVAIDYSLDGTNWTKLGDFVFEQGASSPHYRPNTTVELAGVTAQYVRLTVLSGYGAFGIYGLSEIRFLYIPTYPRRPQPDSGAIDVPVDTTLSWRPGRGAVSHQLLIATDPQQMEDGSAKTVEPATNHYQPGDLVLGQDYYWQVIELGTDQPISRWAGPIWGFSTQQYVLVDGFETYTDNKDAQEAIWQAWADGYGTTTNGSQVGHATAPFAERVIVHRGWQSMPFYYNNSSAPISEAMRTFEGGQDWTKAGIRYLVLYFQGQQTNTPGSMYLKINGVQVRYDRDPSDLTRPFWIQWTVDLAKVNTDLGNVRTLTIGIDNGGMGTLYFDNIRLYRIAPQQATAGVWVEAEHAESIRMPMRIFSDRPDASGGGYIAALGDNSTGSPPEAGIAAYTVRLEPGTYAIAGRVIAPTGNDDSFWLLLDGATTNTANHVSGWVRWGLTLGDQWHETPVTSMDDNDQTVLFTVAGGLYNLQIAFREDGALLDAFMITRQQ